MLWKTYFHQTCFSIKNVDINHGILFSLILVFGWTFEMKALWFSTLYIEAVKLFFIVNKSFISKRLNHKRTSCFWNYGKRGDYKSLLSLIWENKAPSWLSHSCVTDLYECAWITTRKIQSLLPTPSELRYDTIQLLFYYTIEVWWA